MWWKYLVEAVLFFVLMGIAGIFWQFVRAPGHMRSVLECRGTLVDFLEFAGHENIVNGAASISDEAGYLGKSVDWLHRSHSIVVGKMINRMFILCVAILVGTYFLGLTYLAVNSGVFILAAVVPPTANIKNMNMDHVRTMAVALLRWHELDAADCATYCRKTRPELAVLHDLVVEM